MLDRLRYRKIVKWLPMRVFHRGAKESEDKSLMTAHCDLPGLATARSDNTGVLFVVKIPRRGF